MPPGPPTLLMLATVAFLLFMFTPGVMSGLYLILFPAGFSDIYPGYNNMAQDSSV